MVNYPNRSGKAGGFDTSPKGIWEGMPPGVLIPRMQEGFPSKEAAVEWPIQWQRAHGKPEAWIKQRLLGMSLVKAE